MRWKGVDTMIYRIGEPGFSNRIDRYRTGNYGEDMMVTHMRCDRCGGTLIRDDSYYHIDGAVYCMDCHEYADKCILESIRNNYIYAL